jgi:uncharacterized protein (DUF885 family)
MMIVLAALAAGSGSSGREEGPAPAGGSSAGTPAAADPTAALARLAQEFWDGHLDAHPVHATFIGVRRYDARLDDITPAGRARNQARLEDVLRRARTIPEKDLGPADRLTRSALITEVEGQLAGLECGIDQWAVDPLEGPQVSLFNIEAFQPVRSFEEAGAMVERWRAMGPYLDAHVANLRRSLAEGKVAVRELVVKVIDEVEDLRVRPDAEWALLKPLETPHPDWPEAQRAGFRKDLTRTVAESVRPALERYGRFLKEEILPRARPQERPGLSNVPGGLDCYRRLIRLHTSLDLTPEQIHQTGLDEVARINREMEALGAKVLGVSDRKEILRRLRTDPALYFKTRDEVAAKAEAALARARAAIPAWFGRLPRAGCEVVRLEPHEEKNSTIAYYREPASDGSRPGRYYINTYAPVTRPRYEAEALAYHESIPGHHLQIAIAQELTGIPEFRKFTGVTAFVEGWALYTERLADEMGLYSADLDRIGMLSYDAWRVCRLVVDTGLHAEGWTRRQANDYMLENTALAENNIVNEVDRYIAWPGQAVAYKTGQLEIARLREEARRRLGARFDIKAFHDAVLENGAVALAPLRQAVEEYIRRASARL